MDLARIEENLDEAISLTSGMSIERAEEIFVELTQMGNPLAAHALILLNVEMTGEEAIEENETIAEQCAQNGDYDSRKEERQGLLDSANDEGMDPAKWNEIYLDQLIEDIKTIRIPPREVVAIRRFMQNVFDGVLFS